VTIVLSIRKELRKSLFTHKVSYILQSLNTIVVEQEYDPITDVGCNISMLRDVLVNGGVSINIMIILAMRYIALGIESLSSIILKMTNNRIVT
jgi:hypothetical protein